MGQNTEKKDAKTRWEQLMTWNFMALPYASYAPETSFNFGVSGVGYFKNKGTKQYSDISFEGGYSLKKQWFVNVNSRLNFKSDDLRWFADVRLHLKHLPDKFYGIGSTWDDVLSEPIDINDDFLYLNFHPQFYVAKNLILGVNLSYRYSNTTVMETVDTLFVGRSVAGFGEMHLLGMGGSISYDSRTNTYYPLKGLFFKVHGMYYEPLIGLSCGMAHIDTDFRAYVPLYKEVLLAMQMKTQWAIGKDKPYQLLPTLGGQDLLRGVRGNQWKNDALIVVQAELRVPLWKFLKAAAFVSAGDVYSLAEWKWGVPKVGYGVGLRACIHEARMNVRFDVARQNYGNNWSFYFTVKEAF